MFVYKMVLHIWAQNEDQNLVMYSTVTSSARHSDGFCVFMQIIMQQHATCDANTRSTYHILATCDTGYVGNTRKDTQSTHVSDAKQLLQENHCVCVFLFFFCEWRLVYTTQLKMSRLNIVNNSVHR